MNNPLLTWVPVWLGVLITMYMNIRSSGERSQRLKDVEQTSKDHTSQLQTHDSRLNKHDIELAESRGFRQGLMIAGAKD